MAIQIGQMVANRKLGPPVVGEVEAVFTAESYLFIYPSCEPTLDSWDSFYPGWREQHIVMVHLNTPAKVVNRQDVSTTEYYKYPFLERMCFPAVDLINLDDIFGEEEHAAGD